MSFAHLTLATRDVRATCEFFQETLLWKPMLRPGNIRTDAAWLEIAPGQALHIIQVAGFEPSRFENEYGRHAAFFFPRSGFPALQERLQSRGAEVIAPLRETPFERFFFRDPNGYVFEVIDSEKGRAPES